MSANTHARGEGKKWSTEQRRSPHSTHGCHTLHPISLARSRYLPLLISPISPSLSFPLSHNTLATWLAARRKACRPGVSRRGSAGKLRRKCAGILCSLHLRSGKPLTRRHFEAVFASRVVSLCVIQGGGESGYDMQVPGIYARCIRLTICSCLCTRLCRLCL